LAHVSELHKFYGEYMGVRIARKHLGWYFKTQGIAKTSFSHIHSIESGTEQLSAINTIFKHFDRLKETAA